MGTVVYHQPKLKIMIKAFVYDIRVARTATLVTPDEIWRIIRFTALTNASDRGTHGFLSGSVTSGLVRSAMLLLNVALRP